MFSKLNNLLNIMTAVLLVAYPHFMRSQGLDPGDVHRMMTSAKEYVAEAMKESKTVRLDRLADAASATYRAGWPSSTP